MPPQPPEQFPSNLDPSRAQGRKFFGGKKQSMGNSVQFDSPAVNQLTKDIDKLSEAMEKFKKTVAEVGQYLTTRGQNAFNTPISRMGDQFKDLKRDIDEAIRSADKAKGLLGGGGVTTGAPASVGAGAAVASPRSTLPAPPAPPQGIVSSIATASATYAGGGGTGGGGGGTPTGGAGGAAAAAKLGTKGNVALRVAETALRAGVNLVHDSASASMLMADVLGPTATLAQTTIRQLIGNLAENMAAYGSISEQLSTIDIGTQIGAGIPGTADVPKNKNIGFEIGRGFWQFMMQGAADARGIVTKGFLGPLGFGSGINDKRNAAANGQLSGDMPPDAQAILDKYQYGSGQLRPSDPNARKGIQQRTGGFYEGVREMQAITPGVGAGQIASQFADYISNTSAQQTGMILGQGAFTSFGAGAQIKSFSDWAKAVMAFLKDQRPGADRGKEFTYGELVSQNFPGSNINVWFSTMGVPQSMVFYWWQYAISQATKQEKDQPFEVTIAQQRGDDLAGQRLVTLSYQAQNEFGLSFAGGYSAALTGERTQQAIARKTGDWKEKIMGLLSGLGVAGGVEMLGAFGLGRAAGESVYKGMPQRVGELGPEIFVPKQEGKIQTASAVRNQAAMLEQDAFMGGGGNGGATFIFHTTLTMQGGGGAQTIEAKRAAELLASHHENEVRRRLARKVG